MANLRSGSTWYVDATGDLEADASIKVVYILLSPATPGSGNPGITLQDRSPSNATKLKLACPTDETIQLNFTDFPIDFFNGIKVSAISGCVATIVTKG